MTSPTVLAKLGWFLMEARGRQINKLKDVVMISPPNADKMCLVLGVIAQTSPSRFQGNHFGPAFRAAAEDTEAQTQLDGFDSSVMLVCTTVLCCCITHHALSMCFATKAAPLGAEHMTEHIVIALYCGLWLVLNSVIAGATCWCEKAGHVIQEQLSPITRCDCLNIAPAQSHVQSLHCPC